MLVNLLQPILDVIEGLLVSAVIDEDDAHGALVIGLGDSPEAFLPRCVPDLELHFLIVDVYLLDLEVNSYITVKMNGERGEYLWWACVKQGSCPQRI